MAKVAVIGAGAVGLYYGARLAQAGNEVGFLMRRDFDAVSKNGLTVLSKDGDFRIEKPLVFEKSEDMGTADWIVCALKATAAGSARKLVEPIAGSRTRLLVLMNGIGLEERFSKWFPAERIFTGIAFTCINRGEPGTVRHIDYGAVTVGHFQNSRDKVAEAAALWDGAKVEINTTGNFLRERWIKQCWNVPFSGLGVLCGGKATRFILDSPALREEVERIQREVVEIANADLRSAGSPETVDAEETVRKMLQSTEQMEDYRSSTVMDFLAGKPMEIDAMFSETVRRAEKHGIDAPRTKLLTGLLEAVNKKEKK